MRACAHTHTNTHKITLVDYISTHANTHTHTHEYTYVYTQYNKEVRFKMTKFVSQQKKFKTTYDSVECNCKERSLTYDTGEHIWVCIPFPRMPA